ncbi:uncharacterized protein LOC144442339 [Glandiceps talaboti]
MATEVTDNQKAKEMGVYTVMTLNMGNNGQSKYASASNRREAVNLILKSIPADIVCVQEIGAPKQSKWLLDLPASYDGSYMNTEKYAGIVWNSELFKSEKRNDPAQKLLQTEKLKDIRTACPDLISRSCIVKLQTLSNKCELIVISWHGKSNCGNKDKENEANGLLKFAQYLSEEEKIPVFIGGDFNYVYKPVSLQKGLKKVAPELSERRKRLRNIDYFIIDEKLNIDNIYAVEAKHINDDKSVNPAVVLEYLNHDAVVGTLTFNSTSRDKQQVSLEATDDKLGLEREKSEDGKDWQVIQISGENENCFYRCCVVAKKYEYMQNYLNGKWDEFTENKLVEEGVRKFRGDLGNLMGTFGEEQLKTEFGDDVFSDGGYKTLEERIQHLKGSEAHPATTIEIFCASKMLKCPLRIYQKHAQGKEQNNCMKKVKDGTKWLTKEEQESPPINLRLTYHGVESPSNHFDILQEFDPLTPRSKGKDVSVTAKKAVARQLKFPASPGSSKSSDKAKMADSEEQTKLSQILSILTQLDQKINKIPEIEEKLANLQTSVDWLHTKFDKHTRHMEKENKELKDKLEILEDKLWSTEEELEDLHEHVRNL